VAARSPSRTHRRRNGDAAEALVARTLLAAGWQVLGQNLRVGRDEIDLLAVDPGPPRTLVFVEVRSNSSNRFGAPEESLAGPKLRRTYRAAWQVLRGGVLPSGTPFPRLPWRVDALIVELAPGLARDAGGPRLRHLRAVGPE
jgi:putative endonuclease